MKAGPKAPVDPSADNARPRTKPQTRTHRETAAYDADCIACQKNAALVDLAAARYCALLTRSHYAQNGVELPESLRRHIDSLTNTSPEHFGGSLCGSSSEAAQSDSSHDDLIDAAQAAAILGCSARWVRRIHTDLDGQQICGRWTFSKRAVVDYAAAKGNQHEH